MISNKNLTVEETAQIQDGKCVECSSETLLVGPEQSGFVNVICDQCKTQYRTPVVRGLCGERVCHYHVRTQAPIALEPIRVYDEGFLMPGTDSIAMHSCHNVEHEQDESYGGRVAVFQVADKRSVLCCQDCGMRLKLAQEVRNWGDLVIYFKQNPQSECYGK